ncbi:MAG: hypothetical protein M1412_08250 [Deltaproteobacteria bacterium]|nr:hypothetical protein [Deltaproteobacteria bacterium]MCL5893133.1 hypothetical protein [Deltaproteobacteria bacterium]
MVKINIPSMAEENTKQFFSFLAKKFGIKKPEVKKGLKDCLHITCFEGENKN